MKNIKNAFTLAELLVGIVLLIFITGITIPVVKKAMPDTDKELVKHTYYQLASVINAIVTDPYLYPTGRFNSPRDYNDTQSDTSYKKDEKFTKAFISKLNILKLEKLGPNEEWPVDSSKTVVKNPTWKRILGYGDEEISEVKTLSAGNNPGLSEQRTCVLTNNRVYICLPSITYVEPPVGMNENLEKDYDRFYTKKDKDTGEEIYGNVLISVFLSEDHNIKNGYYFAVNNVGKLVLLPTENVTCFGKSTGGEGLEDDCSCANETVYNEYKHCKLYEYLAHIK